MTTDTQIPAEAPKCGENEHKLQNALTTSKDKIFDIISMIKYFIANFLRFTPQLVLMILVVCPLSQPVYASEQDEIRKKFQVWDTDDSDESDIYTYYYYFQSNGLDCEGSRGPFYGGGFHMRDMKGKKTPRLSAVRTPFTLNKGGEEVTFDIEVNQGEKEGDLYSLILHVAFDKWDMRPKAADLVGAGKSYMENGKCIYKGEPLNFYVKIQKKGQSEAIIDNQVPDNCDLGQSSLFFNKYIYSLKLQGGEYVITVKNLKKTNAFDEYHLFFDVFQNW